MAIKVKAGLAGAELEAWQGYLFSHAAITRQLEAELVTKHGLTARDYEVLYCLAQQPERKLPMSELAERTKLTRSGITRLIDGLKRGGLVERISCPSDARVSYAGLTEAGYDRLREAGGTYIEGVRSAFLQHFSSEEIDQLADLLGRLPSGGCDGGSCAVS